MGEGLQLWRAGLQALGPGPLSKGFLHKLKGCDAPNAPRVPRAHLCVALVHLPALELVAEQQGAQLAVLVLDVVLDGRLARPAQLVHLLQVVPVHLDLLVVPALGVEGGQRLRVLGRLRSNLSSLTSGVTVPTLILLPPLPSGTNSPLSMVTLAPGSKGWPRAWDMAGAHR